jgi:hypothetical protein
MPNTVKTVGHIAWSPSGDHAEASLPRSFTIATFFTPLHANYMALVPRGHQVATYVAARGEYQCRPPTGRRREFVPASGGMYSLRIRDYARVVEGARDLVRRRLMTTAD